MKKYILGTSCFCLFMAGIIVSGNAVNCPRLNTSTKKNDFLTTLKSVEQNPDRPKSTNPFSFAESEWIMPWDKLEKLRNSGPLSFTLVKRENLPTGLTACQYKVNFKKTGEQGNFRMRTTEPIAAKH